MIIPKLSTMYIVQCDECLRTLQPERTITNAEIKADRIGWQTPMSDVPSWRTNAHLCATCRKDKPQ